MTKQERNALRLKRIDRLAYFRAQQESLETSFVGERVIKYWKEIYRLRAKYGFGR